MFWIILSIIGFLATGTQIYRYVEETKKGDLPGFSGQGAVYITITAVCMLLVVAQTISGITDYPYLAKKYTQIESLQNRIQDIRESTYEYKKDGNLVAGSVENLSQSTNLSRFISDLAQKEADYTGYLKRCKIFKEVFALYFFGDGWAVSDKIYDLPTTFTKK